MVARRQCRIVECPHCTRRTWPPATELRVVFYIIDSAIGELGGKTKVKGKTCRRLALCNIEITLPMTRNLASGTRSQALKACIIPPLKSFPGVEVMYVKGSSNAFNVD